MMSTIVIPHYETARTGIVAFDLASWGKVRLMGKDRAAFLQNFTTNDVVKPGSGYGCETFVTTAQARIVAWLRVAIHAEWIDTNMEPGLAAKVMSHLDRHIIGEDVQLEDRTESDCMLFITGEQLFSLVRDALKWVTWQHQTSVWNSASITIQRCDFLGLPGVFLWGNRVDRACIEEHLHKLSVPLLDRHAPLWNTLRLEAGTPEHGADIEESFLPQEANRTEQAISFNKGCYVGQETVARIRAYGRVNKQLVRVLLPDASVDQTNWSGATVKDSEKEAGKLKTVAWSPVHGCLMAFALVRKEHLQPGTTLQANHADGSSTVVQVMAVHAAPVD